MEKFCPFQFSIEDAECCNDLSELLPNFKTSSVILGAITVARSAIESEQLIKSRVEEALKHIDRERLILAPDCGLGFLTNQMIDSKVENMVKVAKVLQKLHFTLEMKKIEINRFSIQIQRFHFIFCNGGKSEYKFFVNFMHAINLNFPPYFILYYFQTVKNIRHATYVQ